MVFFLSWNADGTRNTFVFTDPVFDDRETCMATLTDKEEIEKYVEGLMEVYNGTIPGVIEAVNCIDQTQFDRLLIMKNEQESKYDT